MAPSGDKQHKDGLKLQERRSQVQIVKYPQGHGFLLNRQIQTPVRLWTSIPLTY